MTTNKVYPIILTNMKKKLSLYSKKFCCSVFNKDNLLIPLTAGLLVFSQFSVFSATFTTTTGGDWSVGSNWGGTAPSSTLETNSTFNINHYMTHTGDLTVPSNPNSELVVNDTLIINGDFIFNSNSSGFKITVPANATLIILGDFDPDGNLSSGYSNFTVNGLVIIDGNLSGGGNGFNINNSSGGKFYVAGSADPTLTGSKWSSISETGDFDDLLALYPDVCALSGSCSTVLPVDFSYFEAFQVDEQEILFTWETLSELNNSHFTIEQSSDLVNYTTIIDNITAAGNSQNAITYNETWISPKYNQAMYYRVKQTDFDGQTSYSKIIVFNHQDNNVDHIDIFPNPSRGQIVICVREELYNSELVIKHLSTEEESMSIQLAENSTLFDFNDLPKGLYLLIFEDQTIEKVIIK